MRLNPLCCVCTENSLCSFLHLHFFNFFFVICTLIFIVGNISTVNILIGAFSSLDGLDKCLELLKKWDLQLTCYTYKCLLQAYLRANDRNRAFQIYGKIRRKGYILDSFAYNMLLDALAKDQKVDQAYKVFEDMKKKYRRPDEFTYTILIRMNGRLGKLNEAIALFEEMVSINGKNYFRFLIPE